MKKARPRAFICCSYINARRFSALSLCVQQRKLLEKSSGQPSKSQGRNESNADGNSTTELPHYDCCQRMVHAFLHLDVAVICVVVGQKDV